MDRIRYNYLVKLKDVSLKTLLSVVEKSRFEVFEKKVGCHLPI